MNNSLWFYSDTQQTYGPVAVPQLIAMIQAGQLVAGHFIMPQGAQEWQYVSASPFAGYLPQVAPSAPVAAPNTAPTPQRAPGQSYRPPQQRATPPASQAVKKSRSGLITSTVVLLLAAGAGGYFWFKPSAAGGSSTTAGGFPTATKEQPFINSLGMKFVPVPGTDVLMCIHETRKKDFAAYANVDPRVHDMWKNTKWFDKPLSTGEDHPVVFVSWHDADAFCDWLSKKEGRSYRLATDHEWCLAACIPDDPNAEEATDGKKWPAERSADPNATTHPVMSFKANKYGVFDLAGNVSEYCSDKLIDWNDMCLCRGGEWEDSRHKAAFQQIEMRASDHSMRLGFRCVLTAKPPPVEEWVPIKRVEGCVSYDPATLQIVDRGADGWLLSDGKIHLQLLDNEEDARLALAMAKQHTQRCLIGRGKRAFEYWTGKSGLEEGLKTTSFDPFDPAKMTIVKLNGAEGWEIEMLRRFDTELRAKTALNFITQHPRLSYIGNHNKRGRMRGEKYKGKPVTDPAYMMVYWED